MYAMGLSQLAQIYQVVNITQIANNTSLKKIHIRKSDSRNRKAGGWVSKCARLNFQCLLQPLILLTFTPRNAPLGTVVENYWNQWSFHGLFTHPILEHNFVISWSFQIIKIYCFVNLQAQCDIRLVCKQTLTREADSALSLCIM